MRKRARIIYNPTSGKEQFKRELPDALIKLEKAGYETSAYATEKIGDATLEAERAMHENYDILIAAGGDGTLNEVVNGIAEKPNRPKLGVIPMGTVNDFGRALHIPNDIMGALDVIIEGHSTKVDIGKMNNRYFINLAAGGQLTQVSYETPSKLKSIVGPFAYYIKGFEMLPQMKAVDLRIEYDGNVFQGEALLFFLGLTNSMAGFEKLVPDAKLDDGYFTLIIVEKSNLAELGHIMTLASRGEHTKHPKVIYEKAKAINISSFTDLQLNVDGEYGGKLPANFLNLERHIDVFAPNDIVNEELINNDHVDDNLIEE
ncbi:diacylglycerol kinase [Staphylococcus aureus]|mgnify:FL=1|uniref:diacylglycerol kinase n=2 Tax=Staphylococcus aureus TaxID=1280 RepID=UPI0001AE9A12|nr:diacylglycerol kinase [Staphylococcus aureus]EGS91008.1 lipid kinase, YegS/Rv2252/BmrU family [Staphylococcus aureus subsp. aureus 21259]HDK8979298.1 diacylglycerol kinase [Staphylococcus aureus USA700-NRS386]HDT6672271.1 diacylglycerol kinase [Staphylococcus aureus M0274]AGU61997.1 Diacylglycerol kinase family protein [Staphylococcus aureus subsp. aureus CN1]AMO17447.1 lipid kinase [Staphylococcus aureus]